MKKIIQALIFLALIGIIASCTTQKRKDDVSGFGKFYHNTTAKYNGYFNANVLLTESIAKLEAQHKDNYNKILPIFPYLVADNPKAVAGDLDEAIKKVSIVAAIHEVSHWRDDCYVIFGKAQYLKTDYEDAEETFRFFKEEFDPNSTKKKVKKKKSNKQRKKERAQNNKEVKKNKKKRAKERKKYNKKIRKSKKKKRKQRSKKSSSKGKKKSDSTSSVKSDDKKQSPISKKDKKKEKAKEEEKKEENPNEGGPFNHKPAYDEGLLWLAKTYIQRDKFFEADLQLNELTSKPFLLESVKAEIPAVRAHYYMEQEKYADAVPHLENAIKVTKDKNKKARYAYIVAQIYQEAGQNSEAAVAYQRALQFSTSYDMEFSSKLNLIKGDWKTGTVSAEATTKALMRMTRDIKNDEYQDQIYFVLAEIALKQNDKPEAIAYLKQSLAASQSNNVQKAESYLLLADLYFEDEDYVNAKNYFDSTLQVLPKNDEQYTRIEKTRDNITGIAENLVIIQEQDSLLNLSNMSDAEKQALAAKIQEEQLEKQRNEIINKAQNNNSGPTLRRNPGVNRGEPSTFFAYDDKKVKKGRRDFTRRWGADRSLEDDWRRSNRRDASTIADNTDGEIVTDRELTKEEIDKLLKDIPSTPDQIKRARTKVEDAMFKLGRLYREQLENNKKCVATLEELVARFPSTRHQLDAYYYLYLAYTDLGNSTKAKEYYAKIIQEHPNSTFAQVLQDPDFLKKNKKEEIKIASYYDETYNIFKQGDYEQTMQRINEAKQKFANTSYMQPKFALLSAMTTGNLKGKDEYVKALKKVVASYPKSEEEKRANEILRILGKGGIAANNVGSNNQGTATGKFKAEPNASHYFIVVIDGNSVRLTDSKNKVSDYHKKYHKLDRLRISNIYLGSNTDTPILVIRRFKNQAKAMAYYDGIQSNKADFMPAGANYQMFPITQNNYRQILKAKSLNGYEDFFSTNYGN